MLLDRLGKELLFFDGGTGTLLQENGLKPGELPETWSIEHPDIMVQIHKKYYEAGSDIVLSNTFGANALKFHDSQLFTGSDCECFCCKFKESGRRRCYGWTEKCIQHLDIGPTGKVIKTNGRSGL